MASQAEKRGKSIPGQKSNRSAPILQLRKRQLRPEGSCGTRLAVQEGTGLVSPHVQVVTGALVDCNWGAVRGVELTSMPCWP